MNLGKKSVISATLIFIILAALLNLIIFTVFSPWEIESTGIKKIFWFSYSFLMVAFVFQIVSIAVGRPKNGFETVFFGIPLTNVSLFYFVITLVLSLTFMILSAFDVKVPFALMFVLEVVVLGLYTIAFIITVYHKSLVVDINDTIKSKVLSIRNFVSDLETLAESTENKQMQTELNKLAENFKYSDPMSNEFVADLDIQLGDSIAELTVYVTDENVEESLKKMKQIQLLLSKRNRRLADNK